MCTYLSQTFCYLQCPNLSKYVTIQKPNSYFLVANFAATLKPNTFDDTNFKRSHARVHLVANCNFVATQRPIGAHTQEEERTFSEADNIFRATIVSVLAHNIVR